MKKFLAFFFCLLYALPVLAQTMSLEQFKTLNFEEMLKKSMEDPTYNEKILIQMAFSMPPEYHQYIMPMIGNMRSISEKTRMMPGIVEWRRKLPTRIAPELKEYAAEHLRYLNPLYYPFLMPEAWPSYYRHAEEEEKKNFIPPVFDINSPAQMEKLFPSSINPNSSIAKLSISYENDKFKKRKYKTLTQGDVKSVMNIMEKFKVLGEGNEGRKRTNILILDFKNQDLFYDAVVSPCESMVTRFGRIDKEGWLDIQLKKENMTKDEYIQKCDRVVKAYRMRLLTPALAREILRLTKEAVKLPPGSDQRKVYLAILHMYDTNKEDVEALDGFDDDLNKTFKEKRMIMSTPLLLDF